MFEFVRKKRRISSKQYTWISPSTHLTLYSSTCPPIPPSVLTTMHKVEYEHDFEIRVTDDHDVLSFESCHASVLLSSMLCVAVCTSCGSMQFYGDHLCAVQCTIHSRWMLLLPKAVVGLGDWLCEPRHAKYVIACLYPVFFASNTGYLCSLQYRTVACSSSLVSQANRAVYANMGVEEARMAWWKSPNLSKIYRLDPILS